MAIAAREGMIEAHKLAIKQLRELSSEYVSGTTNFGSYREALPVEEVVVEYTAQRQRSPTTVTIKVGEVTERPLNKSRTQLSLPYSNSIYHSTTGFGLDNPPAGILVVADSPTWGRVWIRLPEQNEWKSCRGSALTWTLA